MKLLAIIEIPGKVSTDHRARVTKNGTFQPKEYRAYMKGAALCAMAARPRGWPLDLRYAVEIAIYEPDAKSRDLDNASKGPLDAMKGVMWNDDRQVDDLRVRRGEIRRGAPSVVVTVRVADARAPEATSPRKARAKTKPATVVARTATQRGLFG